MRRALLTVATAPRGLAARVLMEDWGSEAQVVLPL